MELLLLITVCLTSHVAFGALPVGRTNTKNVDAICVLDDQGYITLEMWAVFGTNPVDKLLAINGDTYQQTGQTTTNEAPCEYTGQLSAGEIKVESRVTAAGVSVQGSNTCGARQYVDNVGDVGYIWQIQLREHFSLGIYTDMDRQYQIVCYVNKALSNYVTASIGVFGVDKEGEAVRVSPINTLSLLEYYAPTGTFIQQTGGVTVNYRYKLRAQSVLKPNRIANFDHHGIAVYSCSYRFSGSPSAIQFINIFGCPNPNNPFQGLSTGFRFARIVTTATEDYFQTETDDFILFTSNPGAKSFSITCYLHYCHTNSDAECQDYCGYQTTSRGKRAVDEDADKISVVIQINDENTANTPAESNQTNEGAGSNSTVIAVASALGILVFIAIVVLILVLVCVRQRRERRHWDNASASSQQHIPNHITEEHIKPAKM